MTEEAGQKLKVLTRQHLLKPLAILLDGKLLVAPKIRSTFSRRLQIAGHFDEEQAQQIAEALLEKPES